MHVGGVAALITLGGGALTIGAGAGVAALITLGGGAPNAGAGAGVCTPTIGVDAGVGDSWMFGEPPVGKLKMARRLSTSSSSAWQLSGVWSDRMAMVSALRQWMILSVVLNVSTARVGCWKKTVSDMMTADVDVLMTVKHL